jgi:hypothetical protein
MNKVFFYDIAVCSRRWLLVLSDDIKKMKFLKLQYFYRIYPISVTVPYRTVPYRTAPYRTETLLFKNAVTFKRDVFDPP